MADEARLSRADALAKVQEMLHGDDSEAKLALTFKFRWELDAAILDYGHAAAMEAHQAMAEILRGGRK